MRRVFLIFLIFAFFSFFIFSQSVSQEEKIEKINSNEIDEEKITEIQNRIDTLNYGIEKDIISLVEVLIKEKDETFETQLLMIFQKTRNVKVREKIIEYFIVMEKDSLADYAVKILEDPYDEKKSTLSYVFRYVSQLKIKDAAPAVMELIKNENEDYYDSAIATIGKIGSSQDAQYIASLLDKDDLTVARKQSLMRSLGELQAIETFDKLVGIAKDTEENTFVRMYAAEAIGKMKKEEAVEVLAELFEETDNNLRTYVIKGISNFNDEKSKSIILEALKDNYYKIRLEAAEASKKQKIVEAVPYLLYRAKNDPETSVKYACYSSLAVLQTDEAVDFLISVVKNKRLSETSRAKATVVLLENNIEKSYEPIFTVARDSLKDDKLKNLRYAMGKEFAKYKNPVFESICRDYLAHKDILTCGTGLDIFMKNDFPGLLEQVKKIAQDDKAGANKRKAKFVLEKLNHSLLDDKLTESK
ncbi:MAG: HEAT repeat domain-containing protein [Treponema sp.]|mgnify:CR=1 FL=1|nr:HEAT repeat domain-containing protein [Treponema sp.]